MSAIVNQAEHSLENFLSQGPTVLPAKGTLVRVSNPSTLGFGQNDEMFHIVVSHFTDSFHASAPRPPFFGRPFHDRAIFGLNVSRDFEELLRDGEAFVGRKQMGESCGLMRLIEPDYTDTQTIAVLVNNYFEYLRTAARPLSSILPPSLINLVQQYMS